MKITEVEVSNIQKITYARIFPDGTMTLIGGKNEQGKSSLLNSIAMAIGGKKLCPQKPIKAGEDYAEITVKLGGDDSAGIGPCEVTRKFWASKDGGYKTELSVVSDDGDPAPGQQGLLDGMLSTSTFDPLSFSRMSSAEQVEVLRSIAGLDFSSLDEEYNRVYADRRVENRRLADAESAAKSLKWNDGVPGELVSTDSIMAEIDAAAKHNMAVSKIREESVAAKQAVNSAMELVSVSQSRIDGLKRELENAESNLARAQSRLDDARLASELAEKNASDATPIPTDGLFRKVKDAERMNVAINQNKACEAARKRLREIQQSSDKMTERLKEIVAEKESRTKAAQMPVAGLGFGDGGVVLNGIPFQQLSKAQQWHISVAIGASLNPTLKTMLVHDGALLDDEHLSEIARIAETYGAQLFVERVGEGGECQVIMRDGEAVGSDKYVG